MSNAGKKTTVKDERVAPQIKLEEEQKGAAVSVKQQIEAYLQRKAEVTQSDHQAFQDYLNQKAQALPAPQDAAAPEQPSKFNRRNLLKVVAGTAVAGEEPRQRPIPGSQADRLPIRAPGTPALATPRRNARTSNER
jgi:hypothetical protein